MNISSHKYKVILELKLEAITDDKLIKKLEERFDKFDFGGIKGYCTIISYTPTFKTITSRYRIPDEFGFNRIEEEGKILLNEFMDIESIRSISYFDYVNENIHSIINQQESWAAGDFEVADSKDVLLVTTQFNEFINPNNPNSQISTELGNLIELASIGAKFHQRLLFFDGYHWQ